MVSVLEPLDKYENNKPFAVWLEDFDDYVLANWGDVDKKRKKAILMQLCGQKVKAYSDSLSATVRADYDQLVAALTQKFSHLANETVERHLFNTMSQNEGESIDSFVIRLRVQAGKCNYRVPSTTKSITIDGTDHNVEIVYSDISDSLIRDRVVVGILDQGTKTALLRENNLTLNSAISIVKARESANERVSALLDNENVEVNAINRKRRYSDTKIKPQISDYSGGKRGKTRYQKEIPEQDIDCSFCGRSHRRGKKNCPAFGQKCSKCGQKNHFSKVCWDNRDKKVNTVQETDEDDEYYYEEGEASLSALSIGMLSTNVNEIKFVENNYKSWSEDVILKGKKTPCKIDTGAECNVISKLVLDEIDDNATITPNNVVLKAYGDRKLPVLGTTIIECVANKIKLPFKFFIVPFKAQTVLGLDTTVKLGFIKPPKSNQCNQIVSTPDSTLTTPHDIAIHKPVSTVVEKSQTCEQKNEITSLKKKFRMVFDTDIVGCLDDKGCKIILKEGAVPVQHPSRKVAFKILPDLKAELERMVKLNVIAPVDEPTDWVGSMVIVKEPGKLRICLDSNDLNKVVKREHWHIPTPEETFAKLSNSKFISKLDLKNGYWQIPLDEKSSILTTFNTPFGRYRYLRLPFGLNSANEIFQKKMIEKFEGIPGVVVMFDDILVVSETLEEHYERLNKVFEQCQKVGIKLNEKKCQFLCDEIMYIGHVITPDGVKPDPEKVKAITEMPAPKDKKGVQRLLGMITYLAKYIPNLSELTQPLRVLLNKKVDFLWTFEQQSAFEKIRDVLAKDAMIAHFDVNKDIEVHTDASKYGLGACLLQDSRPVAYASRSLTPTEMHYANIEKELLSVVFGLERFNQYVYGQHIKVITDHKPLVPMHEKHIIANPGRCQRLLLRLQKYSFDISYKPGKDHVIPDVLSRAALITEKGDEQLEKECELNIHMIVENNVECSNEMKLKIETETLRDPCTSRIMEYIRHGWPNSIQQCDPNVTPYWNVKDNLSILDGFVLYCDRIVIPKVLQPDMLQKIHAGHQGRVRSKALAHQAVYWNNMNSDIDNVVNSCEKCLSTRKLPDKISLESHVVPNRPFEKVGADILTVFGSKFHVVVDYFSKYIEINKLPINPTSNTLIEHFIDIFTRFGFPDTLFSDQESIYKSTEMQEFCKKYDITKKFSAARHSQSNGQVERAIGHVKNIIRRCNGNITEIKLCLLDYNATPLDAQLGSPHSILMNRQVRCRLPLLNKNMVTDNDKINREKLVSRQLNSAKYYNRDAKVQFTKFSPGDTVVYRDGTGHRDNWRQAKVISVGHKFRSYTLLNRNGSVITRSRNHLLPDNTGKEFYVASEECLLATSGNPTLDSPTHAKSTEPLNSDSCSKSDSTPHSMVSAPPQTQTPHVVIPKTAVPPEIVKNLKLNNYAQRHNTKVLPKFNYLPPTPSDTVVVKDLPLRRSERLAKKRDCD